MEYERCGYDTACLDEYAALFRTCFPRADNLASIEYLHWLYAENPAGTVVGFNAREAGRLVAHYVCVPAQTRLEGRTAKALLSLNTATHPDFQGRGLFTKLAELTYGAAASEGAELVYGVANANSTPGFLRKLGFQLIGPLESRVGVGGIGAIAWAALDERAGFQRAWPEDHLLWRVRNPVNSVAIHERLDGSTALSARAGRAVLRAWAQLPNVAALQSERVPEPFGVRLWLGMMPEGIGRIGAFPRLPDRLRPSPLNLIVRSLRQNLQIKREDTFFTFLDFDAF